MAGTTNYPGALDTTTNLPIASALATVELDGDGNANKVHSNLHGVLSEAAVAIEGKIGTGASTPIASRVLRGSGTGTSAWAQVALATDVSGTLPLASLATGALDSGFSITSGFGTIDNGSSSITTTGAVATGELTASGDIFTVTTSGQALITATSDSVSEMRAMSHGHSAGGEFSARSTGGTAASISATLSGGIIARFAGYGFGDDAYKFGGRLKFVNSEGAVWTNSATGTEAVMEVTPNDTDSPIDAMVWENSGDITMLAAKKLRLDGSASGDTYIYEESADDLHIVVGGAIMVAIDQDSTNIGIGNGSDVVADTMVSVNGSFSHGSPGAFQVEAALTTTSAGTAAKHFLVGGSGSSITTNFAGTGVAARISTAEFFEPNITLGTSDTATIASTLYVANAPDEGTTNAAIYVASGDIRAEGGIGIGEAPSANNVISIQKNQAAFTEINIGNTNASGSSGIRLGSSVASGVFTSNSSSAIPSGGVGVVNTTGIYTDSSSLDISFGTGTTEQMRIDTGTGTVFVGGGSFTAHTEANDLVVGSTSGRNGMTILSGTSSGDKASIFFADSGGTYRGMIRYNNNDDSMGIATADTDAIFIDSNQTVFMGDSANANMTVGLTINQGANDDQILALKSSDVGHGMLGNGLVAVETDDFLAIRKRDANGGAHIGTFMNNGGGNRVLNFSAAGGTPDQTDTASSQAMILFNAVLHADSDVRVSLDDTDNAFGVNTHNNGGFGTRFLIKGNGTLHATNVTAGSGDLDGVALDGEDDIALIRAHQTHRSQGMGMAMTKWDEAMQANKDDLIRVGVYGSDASLYNMQRMNDLLGGAIWQGHTNHMSLAEKVDGLEVQLIEAKKQLAAISA